MLNALIYSIMIINNNWISIKIKKSEESSINGFNIILFNY